MTWWVKIDANIHQHPKAIAAGWEGTAVFVSLLTLNGTLEADGKIPASHAKPIYLARIWGAAEETIERGLTSACVANLIRIDEHDGRIEIVGWDEEWCPPMTPTERSRRFRERHATKRNGVQRNATDETILDQTRLDKKRQDPEETQSPARARVGRTGSKKAVILTRHREAALLLWKTQEDIRVGLGLGSHRREPTDERLTRIAERLETGATVAECEHVLSVYEADAKRTKTAQWFDGVTNWRPDNFERALGKPRGNGAKQQSLGVGYVRVTKETMDESFNKPTGMAKL